MAGPSLKPETVRSEKDGRKGILLALLSKLGLQGTSSAFATWTGASAVSAKAALGALALAGTGAAAGVGMWNLYGSGSGGEPLSRMFFETPRAAVQSRGSGSAGSAQGAPAARSSLDYVAGGQGDIGAGSSEAPPPGAGAPSETSAAVSASPTPMSRPQMVKSQGFGPGATSSNGGMKLPEQEGLAGGIGAKFQPLARPEPAAPRQATARELAATRRTAMAQGRGASGQLALTNQVVRGNLRSNAVSSPASGVTYDGGSVAGAKASGATGPSPGGVSAGGAGLQSGPNAALSAIRNTSPPPPGVSGFSNRTPYQWLIYSAIGTLLLSLLTLIASNMLAKQAKKELNPVTAAAKLKLAKTLAALSIAAAGATMGLGSILIGKYGQNLQGGLFVGAGVLLGFQATLALIKDDAAQKGQAGVKTTADDTQLISNEKLDKPLKGDFNPSDKKYA